MFVCKRCFSDKFVDLKYFYACKNCRKTYSKEEIISSIDYLIDNNKSVIEKELYINSSINFVKIPKSVITIKKGAFENCKNLVSVFFDNDSLLESIEDNVFVNCVNLSSIDFPKSLKHLGKNVFDNTKFLKKAEIFNGVKYIGNLNNNYYIAYQLVNLNKEIKLHKDTILITDDVFDNNII